MNVDKDITLCSVTVGSRLFGTARPTSDYDFIHIYRPSLDSLVLGKQEQPSQKKEAKSLRADPLDANSNLVDVEHTYWTIQHFFKLLAQGQTQALEIMFAPPTYWSSGDSRHSASEKYWHDFRKEFDKNRAKWISRNTAAFVGYCKSQANKYSVKGERLYAVDYLTQRLRQWHGQGRITRKLTEYPELLEELRKCNVPYLGTMLIESQGTWMEHIVCCNVKCPVHFTLAQAHSMYDSLFSEYGRRAHAAKTNGAIDWKALSHAARVTIEAKELLKDHVITLPLKEADREWVRDIKQGNVAHSAVVEFLDSGLQDIEELRDKTTLAESVNRELYEEWILRAYKGEKVT